MDLSLLVSSVHEIFPGKNIGVVVISSSRGSAQPRDQTCGFWIGRLILYYLTAWETHTDVGPPIFLRTALYS